MMRHRVLVALAALLAAVPPASALPSYSLDELAATSQQTRGMARAAADLLRHEHVDLAAVRVLHRTMDEHATDLQTRVNRLLASSYPLTGTQRRELIRLQQLVLTLHTSVALKGDLLHSQAAEQQRPRLRQQARDVATHADSIQRAAQRLRE